MAEYKIQCSISSILLGVTDPEWAEKLALHYTYIYDLKQINILYVRK